MRLALLARPRALQIRFADWRTLARAVSLAIATAGCLDDDLAAGGGIAGGETFIALQSDFQAWRSWERFHVGDEPVTGGHEDPGARYAYLSARPPSGATTFPVGTMIAKATESGDVTTWTVHAMVKRGGGFNAGGAVGWEWFDLQVDEDDDTVIMWRGFEPPSGHGYGGDGSDDADCNSCHAAAGTWATDYVLSAALAPVSL